MRLRITSATRAQAARNKLVREILGHEDPEDLRKYIEAEDIVLDALALFDDAYSTEVREIYEEHHAMLIAGQECVKRNAQAASGAPVTAQSSKPYGDVKMNMPFKIDTGDTGGSLGPWVRWSSEGSARKRIAPETWVLRSKDENGESYEEAIDGFVKGCVLDLDTLKLGWEKDGAKGQAPERRWNPSLAQALPRPDDSKKAAGGYAWSQALSVRIALSKEEAATWEQGSFGAYQAFTRLARQIEADYRDDGTLPYVRQTGIETRQLSNGNTAIPILEIVKWVERPACLKASAPKIDTGDDEAPKATKAKAAPPPPADDDEEF